MAGDAEAADGKSSVEEIRARFDADVDRFSNLETGQQATVDAAATMDLGARAAVAVTPAARHLIDLGCGAGNYTLKFLQRQPAGSSPVDITLVDLSRPMLDRAVERVSAVSRGVVTAVQADVREFKQTVDSADVILAAAVLHHLRTDAEWDAVFAKMAAWLRPGGSAWIFDLVQSSIPAVEALQRSRWGEYLVALKGGGEPGEAYRDAVFDYVAREDSPRPLVEQLDRLRAAGFTAVDVLQANQNFAAYGGVV